MYDPIAKLDLAVYICGEAHRDSVRWDENVTGVGPQATPARE